jgi:hypothetical protein
MTNVINPEIRIYIETLFDDEWDSAEEDTRLDIDIDVVKDLHGEPNIATVRIYNLNDETIKLLSSYNSSIDIGYTLFGKSDFVQCFLGEISQVWSDDLHPGRCTTIVAESQRFHSRDKYIDLSYEATTALSLIVDDLTKEIGLPVQSVTIPDASIAKAMHLTGPAFLNLQEILKTALGGMFAYITDGVLYISSVFEPPALSETPSTEQLSTSLSDLEMFQSDNPTGLGGEQAATVVMITQSMMTSKPSPSSRQDVTDLWYTFALNDDRAAEAADMFEANESKVKKISKKKVRDANKELVEVDAVSTEIQGIDLETFGIPNLQPDTVIQIEGDDHYYRVKRINHNGDNHDGVYCMIQADLYGE